MRAVEIAYTYGIEICDCRRLTDEEKLNYTEWCREIILICTGNNSNLEHLTHKDVFDIIGHRKADGSFLGCSNNSWSISDAEADALIKLNTEKAEAKIKAKKEQTSKRRLLWNLKVIQMQVNIKCLRRY